MALSKCFTQIIPVLEEKDIEDILLLSCANKTGVIPRIQTFELNSLVDEFCFLNFRFYKEDLLRLKKGLKLHGSIICKNGIKVGAIKALCITLRRLAYPNRYVDLLKLFPRTRCELSRVFNEVIRHICATHHNVLTLAHPYLTLDKLQKFVIAIVEKGSPYKNCFGFIDGTVRPMCRPGIDQREYYNGHKRVHALKFQSIMLPDGIIASLYGPVDGRRHDAYILHDSGIMDELEQRFNLQNGDALYVYGDPAYPLQRHLMVPFKGHNLTPQKRRCNKKMSKVRQCVEWGFGKIVTTFAFLDFKKNLKLRLQPVSEYYKVGALLTNCHTCVYGSQTSDFFLMDPPTLEVYLDM